MIGKIESKFFFYQKKFAFYFLSADAYSRRSPSSPFSFLVLVKRKDDTEAGRSWYSGLPRPRLVAMRNFAPVPRLLRVTVLSLLTCKTPPYCLWSFARQIVKIGV